MPGPTALADDSDATLIHRRTSSASADIARQKREGAAPATAAARLVCLSGSQKDASFPVEAAGITIGRSPSCDVVLTDHRVSSRHAWIGIANGKFVLRDLKSTNGTFINTQTRSSVGEIELRSGDTVFFGSHQGDQFRFLTD
ncbi:MAG: FHA domain-containing protein [Rhodocyclales bacterium]|nr:FHA domain-containing protein [Rhodocyclales bacterium]